MFDISLSDAQINLIITVICTFLVTSVFLKMSFSYTQKRANNKFAKGKQAAPSLTSFRTLSKVLFVSSMLLTLVSYWLSFPWLLSIENSFLQLFGVAMILFGYINLDRAFSNLGHNYSPLFDAYIPFELITSGSYQHIRHPIYLYNLLISFGLAVSSSSLLVLINAVIGLFFVLKAIQIEELYLAKHFPYYKSYSRNSWRLIPYLY